MNDVYFYEAFVEEEAVLRALLPAGMNVGFTDQAIQESGHRQPPARLISIRTQSSIPMEWSGHLDGILSRSQGFDHLENYFRQTGTSAVLGYLPPYCSIAVAEHALAAALILNRKFKQQQRQFVSFYRDHLTGMECCGQKAVVVGVGNIGREIIRLATAIGFDVCGVDVDPREAGVRYVSLAEGIMESRMVFCALPLIDQTRGLLAGDLFRQGVSGKILVNISRGEITPLAQMRRLLDEGFLGGLALDVFENEGDLVRALRSSEDLLKGDAGMIRDLAKRDNVLFTPHNAFNTIQGLERKSAFSVEAVKLFMESRRFPREMVKNSGCH